MDTTLRDVSRFALAGLLLTTGAGHLRRNRDVLALVPTFFPARGLIVDVAGVVEIALGSGLVAAPAQHRVTVGRFVAVFIVLVFPGNVFQLVSGADTLGLDTTRKRVVRLFLQPVLVVWALWSTGA